MRAFFYSLLGYFLTPAGLILMGALDSSLIFFLPLGIDFAVIVLGRAQARSCSGSTRCWPRPVR